MKPIGILGGTFDPVHIAHLRLAIEALEQLRLERIQLMPCNIPPHRDRTQASSTQRIAMLELAIADTPGLQIDDRELNRPGKSYTVDSLLSLRNDYPQTPLCLIVGLDAFMELNQWKHWRQLIDLCHIAVASRPGVNSKFNPEIQRLIDQKKTDDCDELHRQLCGQIIFLKLEDLAISSSGIRKNRQQRKDIRHWVTKNVYHYITTQQLYT